MEWTQSKTLALALQSCTKCHGLGMREIRDGVSNPCACVFRAIFRACYHRFRHCVEKEKYLSKVSLQFSPGRDGRFCWGRKDEEYIADFYLVSKRSLNEQEFRLFKYHFLLGADWKLCCRKLNMDRGNFFHAIYRIQQKLGRIFAELQPYALFPLDEYFQVTTRQLASAKVRKVIELPLNRLSERVPLRKVS